MKVKDMELDFTTKVGDRVKIIGTNKIGTLHDVSSQTNNLGDGCYLRFQNTSGTLDYDAEL